MLDTVELEGQEKLNSMQRKVFDMLQESSQGVVTYYQLSKDPEIAWLSNLYTQEHLGGLFQLFEDTPYSLEYHDWNRTSLGIGIIRREEMLRDARNELDQRLKQSVAEQVLMEVPLTRLFEFDLEVAEKDKLKCNKYQISIPEIDTHRLPQPFIAFVHCEDEIAPIFFTSKEQHACFKVFCQNGGYIDEIVARNSGENFSIKSSKDHVNKVLGNILPTQAKFMDGVSPKGQGLFGDSQRRADYIRNWLSSQMKITGTPLFNDFSTHRGIPLLDLGMNLWVVNIPSAFKNLNGKQQVFDISEKNPELLLVDDGFGIEVIEISKEEARVIGGYFRTNSRVDLGTNRGQASKMTADKRTGITSEKERIKESFGNFLEKLNSRGYRLKKSGKSSRTELVFPEIVTHTRFNFDE